MASTWTGDKSVRSLNWRSRKTGTWHLLTRQPVDRAAELAVMLVRDPDVEVLVIGEGL
jgi:hypothetical protein